MKISKLKRILHPKRKTMARRTKNAIRAMSRRLTNSLYGNSINDYNFKNLEYIGLKKLLE